MSPETDRLCEARAPIRVAWLALWFIALAAPLCAQDPPPSLEAVEARIAETQRNEDARERDQILAALEEAKRRLEGAATFRQRREALAAARVAAGDDLIAARTALAAATPAPDYANVDLGQLESERTLATARRDSAKSAEAAAKQTVAARGADRAELPGLLAKARDRRESILPAAPPTNGTPQLIEALQWAHSATLLELDANIAALEERERNLEDRTLEDLRQAELELAAKQTAASEKALRELQTALEARRAEDARISQEQAARRAEAAQDDHPIVALLSRLNASLATERQQMTQRLAVEERRNHQLTQIHAQLTKDVSDLKERIKVAGGRLDSVGPLLRQQQRNIQSAARTSKVTLDADDDLGELQLRWMQLDQQILTLERDLPAEEMLRALDVYDPALWPAGVVPPPEQRRLDGIEPRVQRLLADHKEKATELRSVCDDLIDARAQTLAESASVKATVDKASRFVNERVLWVRSTTPIWRPQFATARAAWVWLTAPENWGSVVAALRADLEGPAMMTLLLLTLVLLVVGVRWGIRRLDHVGLAAARGDTATVEMTLIAVALTVLTAMPVPLVLAAIGLRLSALPLDDAFPAACGHGLVAAAWLLFLGGLLRRTTRVNGLAAVHFRWPQATQGTLRRNLAWALPAALPLTWALTTLKASGNDTWAQAGGRPALILLLATLTAFLWRVLHPGSGLLSGVRADRAGLFVRWRRVWAWLGIATPLLLLGMSSLGYQFTAVELLLRLLATIGVAFGLVVVYSVVLRGLALARRDLARKQAATASPGKDAASGEPPPVVIDLGAVGQQTRALLHGMFALLLLVGAWLLWVDVIPALGVLREIVFWSDVVGGETVSVTLASFLLAAVYVGATLLAARNIPGTLELLVLQRLDIHAGARHAATTIARYLILAVGLTAAFGAIGIGWSKVQWLVAALGVGLGFGLQEIFANFVSGIIILLEQPVRVGDLVTVSDTDGYITQIRMRATIVTDYDRKELIIPNKEFITGKVVNWSLTDPVVRVVIKVGVAYGTEPDKVLETLLQVGRESPITLNSPRPKALFSGFGDSTLDFQLRVFISSMEAWPQLMNDVNTRIAKAFEREGIEIAFPQRDLHIRTAPGLVAFAERIGGMRPPVEGSPA